MNCIYGVELFNIEKRVVSVTISEAQRHATTLMDVEAEKAEDDALLPVHNILSDMIDMIEKRVQERENDNMVILSELNRVIAKKDREIENLRSQINGTATKETS